jgi:hypothetical protein
MSRAPFLLTLLAAGLMAVSAHAAVLHFEADLTGASEVPPTTSKGTGKLLARLDTKTGELSYSLVWADLTGPATAAHFHGPAAPGVNAPVVIPIPPPITGANSGTVTLTPAQMKELEASKWYTNVHTEMNKGGEIRGQLLHAGD